jgi:acyl-CoA thioesterase I
MLVVVLRRESTLVLSLFLLAGCGADPGKPGAAPVAPSYEPAAPELRAGKVETAPETAAGAAASSAPPLVVFLGDSLSAGYGLEEDEAFPARVAELLAARGRPIRAVNAGVSGDTSAGGLARLDWLLRQKPDVLVVELGGNDGLRGQPVAATEANLRAIARRSLDAGVEVLLVGIQVPPNYGPDYARDFAAIFPRLATELNLRLLPFLLEGVAGDPQLNLPDGIHPTAAGHERVAENVVPPLLQILEAL